MEDIQSPQYLSECAGSVSGLVEKYNKSVLRIINHRDPFCSRYSYKVRSAKKSRSTAERLFHEDRGIGE